VAPIALKSVDSLPTAPRTAFLATVMKLWGFALLFPDIRRPTAIWCARVAAFCCSDAIELRSIREASGLLETDYIQRKGRRKATVLVQYIGDTFGIGGLLRAGCAGVNPFSDFSLAALNREARAWERVMFPNEHQPPRARTAGIFISSRRFSIMAVQRAQSFGRDLPAPPVGGHP
jgi:hypothetical protein